MTDHNRGAYTPQSEAPLAFDARRSRGGGGGGGGDRPFPLALVISAVILVLIVIALVVFLMRQPDGSETAAETGEVIDAMKIPPPVEAVPIAPPPGMQVAVEDPDTGAAPAFTPPPEQPAARPAPSADPVGALIAPPRAAPTPVASNSPKVTPAPVAPAPPRAATPPAVAGASGAASVQIGAFTSAALAEKGWNDLAGLFPGQMAGKTKRVEMIEANGATLHRAFVGGFGSRAQAEAFCASLKAANRQCLVR